jgi:P27 family predicted phage terminase small subunit
MRGRTPQPVAYHIANGTYRRDRHGGTPQPQAAIPKAPAGMDAAARKLWRYYAPRLVKVRVLTELDREALATYCSAAARRAKAESEIAKTGEVVRSPAGFAAVSPWLNVANKAAEIMLRYGQELGLSAAARTRIRAAPQQPNTSASELLRESRREQA